MDAREVLYTTRSIRRVKPDPIPDDDHVNRNTVLGNGSDPDPRLAPLPPADLLWDGTGTGNCWEANTFASAFPNPLPPCDLF